MIYLMSCKRGAFTAIELVVVVATIGVLIALTLPTIANTRRSAQRTVSLANLGGIGRTTGLYVNEYDAYPFGTGGWVRHPDWSDSPSLVGFPVWALDRLWPVLMHEIAPWPSSADAWLAPGADRDLFRRFWRDGESTVVTNEITPSYAYSHTFLADPIVWASEASVMTSAPIRAIRPGEVRTPSSKVMFFDADMPYEQARDGPRDARPVLHADGSGAIVSDLAASPPAARNQLTGHEGRIYRDTRNGVAGVDR